jgi:predicted XRE-type DNA-binding protein
MRRKDNLKVAPSNGNVFRELGFSAGESEHLLIRADLLLQLQKTLAVRQLTQVQTARLLHVTPSRIRDLQHGRIDLFRADGLIDMLARFGVPVALEPGGTRCSHAAARRCRQSCSWRRRENRARSPGRTRQRLRAAAERVAAGDRGRAGGWAAKRGPSERS